LAEGTAFAAVGDLGGATVNGGGGVTLGFGAGDAETRPGGAEGVGAAAATEPPSAKPAAEKATGQTIKKMRTVFLRTILNRIKSSTL